MTRRDAGFSLPELLAAVALLGLVLAGGALASQGLLARHRLETAAGDLAWSLRGARDRAARLSAPSGVAFDVPGGRWATDGRRPERLPPGIRFAAPDAAPPVTFAVQGTGATAALFGPRGRLLAAATPARAVVGIPERGAYLQVEVTVAGTVRVARWEAGAWR